MIYLDVCCLNRPFDNQRQDRIRIESEAVLAILADCEAGRLQLVTSEVAFWEIEAIPHVERKDKVAAFLKISQHVIHVDSAIVARGREIEKLGFTGYDALHIACAEQGCAEAFLTVDDGILARAGRNAGRIQVEIANPVVWLMERVWKEDANNDFERN